MSKKVIKPIVLIVVFIAALITFCITTNKGNKDMTTKQADATLPVMSFNLDKIKINTLHGYTTEMDPTKMRDCVIPISDDRKLSLSISTYGMAVDRISYKIRSMDGKRLVADDEISSFSNKDNTIQADVNMPNVMDENTEYLLVFTITSGQDNVYYYSRIMQTDGKAAAKVVEFAKKFHDETFIKDDKSFFTTYMETTTGDRNTLAHVDLTSTVSQITWGSMAAAQYTNPVIALKEINDSYDVVTIDYVMSCVDGKGETEYYNVREYFRLRQTESRMYVLNYERTANQIFNSENSFISDSGSVMLGIRSSEAEYRANEAGSVICFVQEGDLYSYDINNGMIIKVFSFRDAEGIDERENWNHHDIKIVSVDEAGSIDFVVYGYMNRGEREGQTGTAVYHYYSDQNVLEEKVFIPSTESYEFLKEDLGTLSYVSTENALYLLFANKLYKINISDGTSEVLEEGIKIDDFAVSDTGAHAAWIIQEGESAGNIKEIDFETLETRSLAPSSGQSLVLNGFMNEDLVYGIVVDGDVIADDNGHETTGIHTVRIEGFDGTLKKEYHQDGLYVTDITMGNTMMEFQLSKKTKKGYKAVSKDNILNNSKASTNTVSVELVTNSRTGTQIRLALTETPEIQEPLVVYAKMKNIGDDRIILDTQIPEEDIYYVYAKGGLDSTFTDPALALQRADDQTGVVLNRAQQYVWERGNKKTKLTLNLEDVPEAMKSASLDVTALQEALGDEGTIIDLSGCTLDSVLYEVSAQRPVIAKTGDNTSVVIIGYDEYNTYLYDPQKGETYPYGMNDSTELFEKAGNIFISYVEKLKL